MKAAIISLRVLTPATLPRSPPQDPSTPAETDNKNISFGGQNVRGIGRRRKYVVFSLVAALAIGQLNFGHHEKVAVAAEPEWHEITFPVQGSTSYYDDFGNARSGGRHHEGNDLMGAKMDHLVAAVAGTLTVVRKDAGSLSGNFISLRGDDGWFYYYIHINNDRPGTDDGSNLTQYAFAPGITQGMRVKRGQFIAYRGDSGNAESTGPHLHFEIHKPGGTAIDPYTSLRIAQGYRVGGRCSFPDYPDKTPSASAGRGYLAVTNGDIVRKFGSATNYGSMSTLSNVKPAKGLEVRPQNDGYWQFSSDGAVHAFGAAADHGDPSSRHVHYPIVGMAVTPSGNGYWLVGSSGKVYPYGDAAFYGDTRDDTLNHPIKDMAATITGHGYWLMSTAGRIYAFGDAVDKGSLWNYSKAGAVSIEASPTGKGYWILGNSGIIRGFGVHTYGSIRAEGMCSFPRAVSFSPTSTGHGYWVLDYKGAVWVYGDARYYSSPQKVGHSSGLFIARAA